MNQPFQDNHPLADLALDMRWSWDHSGDRLWRQLDPEIWDDTHNPWIILQTVSRNRLDEVMADPAFRKNLADLMLARQQSAVKPAWFQNTYGPGALSSVAYFSMEFMLHEALPIYSGGLGNVAGDQLKAASDLGVPVIGVGLLYQQGYFRQVIDSDGAQQAVYPYNDPGQLPIAPLRGADGEWLRLRLDLPGMPIWLRTWQVQVGRIMLYLLDSNDAANYPPYRGITGELYGGSPELRLQQELILGIGGWQLLTALGVAPEVCHLNEGHAAFAVLERARRFMETSGQTFEAALAVTRAGNLFTTHTAVAAGFDRFAPALIQRYLGGYAGQYLGIAPCDLLALGRQNPVDDAEAFNMAYLAVRGCGAVNGVSRLHGEVSRRILSPLFPQWPALEMPIGHVTNGVHMPTWDSEAADKLWTEACGKNRWLGPAEMLAQDIRRVSDAVIWQFREAARIALVQCIRNRLSRQLALSIATADAIDKARHVFDSDVLTLGFARRFAAYKRPNLLLCDPERLIRLLTDPERPVQLVLAGKAHPADLEGQALIRQWTQFVGRPEVRGRVVFLGDYDMLLTEQLVQGVDVWLNTPRRPWEASGTSGMKVLVNGGVNLSELDGWWAEAYAPDVGWALGDGLEHGDDLSLDTAEAETLYDLLEREVIPEFYNRDASGIPAAWVARIRESMARLTPQYATNRSVREYAEHYYLPAAAAYRERAANRGESGARFVEWKRKLDRQWPALRFGVCTTEKDGNQYKMTAQVNLGDLDPGSVRLEIYADDLQNGLPARQIMEQADRPAGLADTYTFQAFVPASRPASDYTVRIIPQYAGITVPLEAANILWQR